MPAILHFVDQAISESAFACGRTADQCLCDWYRVGSHLDGRSVLRFAFLPRACPRCVEVLTERITKALGIEE